MNHLKFELTAPSMFRSPFRDSTSGARFPRALILALAIFSSPCLSQVTPEKLLQEAAYREEVEGDLEGAARLCVQIIDGPSRNDSLLVCANLRLASCYEKQGDARALEVYRNVMRRFPRYSDAVRIAQTRLAALSARTPDYSAMIDYYISRVAVEPLGALSPDGTMEAHTDWESGNLVVKNRKTGGVAELTHKTWSESPEFAYYKVWSPDGKKIAYGWYKNGSCVGLRTVAASGGEPDIILERDGWVVFPTDWSRDGRRILARVIRRDHAHSGDSLVLALIGVPHGEYEPLMTIDQNSRGLQISPDGGYIALDLPREGEDRRQIFVFSLGSRVLTKLSDLVRGDTPLWSQDGAQVLFRVSSASDAHLMSVPVRHGVAAGNAIPLQMNIQAEIQRRAGIKPADLAAAVEKMERATLLWDKPAQTAFDDDFASPRLDPAWKVVQWEGPNVYGFKTFGRISLTDRPGHLRYYLDPVALWMLSPSKTIFAEWEGYWYYPALQLLRRLAGRSWVLEARATYAVVRDADTRYGSVSVVFSDNGISTAWATLERVKSWSSEPSFGLRLSHGGKTVAKAQSVALPGDTLGPLPYSCHIRFVRKDTLLSVEMSEDGVSFLPIRSAVFPQAAFGTEQRLVIAGGGWFTPAGSYVEFDNIRLRPGPAKQ